MTRDEATEAATLIANEDKIVMVVTHNEYAEESDEAEQYGFFPEQAARIFKYENVVETIRPTEGERK